MIGFIVILLLLVAAVGAAYYFFNKKKLSPQKKSTKPFKVELYDKAGCTGEVVRSIGTGVGIPLDTVFSVKPEEGDEQKVCCMKVSNAKIKSGWVYRQKLEPLQIDRVEFPDEQTFDFEECSADYNFTMSPFI